MMDAENIFKKLTRGAKFNIDKYHQDAQKLHVLQPKLDIKPFTLKDEKQSEINKKQADEELHPLNDEEVNAIRRKCKISVVGKDIPAPIQTFEQLKSEYKVSQNIIENMKRCGFSVPTEIQMQAIPIMLKKRQILACAPTGSGKTVAFLVPIIHHLKGPQKKGFRAVIVSPTRELAKQIYRESLRLAEGTNLKIFIIRKMNEAVQKFRPEAARKFDMLITTPNRLIYLLAQDPPVLDLHNVEWLVIDESDKLFESGQNGFRDQLAEIYRACDSNTIKRAMFSATHTPDVAKWARKHFSGLISVTVGHRNTAADIVLQELLFVGTEPGKMIAFRNLVHQGLSPPVLVFVQSKERAKELFNELLYDGVNVDVIHADRTQLQRDNVVQCFREGKIWVLICTELMGRGIDFKGVNLVINYDFPPSAISYIHRIGRTGRAGRPGKAITFFTEDDIVNLRSIAQVIKDSGCGIPEYILNLKKTHKTIRKKLQKKAPVRESISSIPAIERRKEKKIKKLVRKRKRSQCSDQSKKTKAG